MQTITKFPNIGTTIFTTMSAMAAKHQAINLGQGFPNFDGDKSLFERLNYHTLNGANQYAPMMGVEKLRLQIAKMQQDIYGLKVNHDSEITITSGATEAIFCAISAVVSHGDEVIVLDPCYDSYVPNIELNGGVAVRVALKAPDFKIDWEEIKSKISPKTVMIMLNTPGNPTGTILEKSDLDALWEIVKNTNIYILSDEVYQHIIFDGNKHISALCDERFTNRTFAISSFGKTYHVTGWKIGYCIAAPELTREFRKVHQYITFSSMASTQLAIADMMETSTSYYSELATFYQSKRDLFLSGLKNTKFKSLKTTGSYFQLVDYSNISDKGDFDFCVELIEKHKVVAIPISSFYEKSPDNQKIIRLCFAKTDDLLNSALANLQKI